jgi:hypothetical protein
MQLPRAVFSSSFISLCSSCTFWVCECVEAIDKWAKHYEMSDDVGMAIKRVASKGITFGAGLRLAGQNTRTRKTKDRDITVRRNLKLQIGMNFKTQIENSRHHTMHVLHVSLARTRVKVENR